MALAANIRSGEVFWVMSLAALSSAVAFFSVSFLPVFPAMVLSLFDAVPLLVCGLLYGWLSGALAGVGACLLVALAQTLGIIIPEAVVHSLSLLFFVETALPSILFLYLAHMLPLYLKTNPLPFPKPVIMQGAITSSVTMYALLLTVFLSILFDPIKIQAAIDQTLNTLKQEDPETMKTLVQAWGDDVFDQLGKAVPALSAIGWLFSFLINAVVAVRLWSMYSKTPAPVMKMAWFRLPRWMVLLVFVLGVVLMLHTRQVFALPQDVFILLNNVLLVALAGFFFNGVGVFHHMVGRRRFVIPLFYLAFFFIPMLIYVVAMVGLLDPVVSMRRDLYPIMKG